IVEVGDASERQDRDRLALARLAVVKAVARCDVAWSDPTRCGCVVRLLRAREIEGLRPRLVANGQELESAHDAGEPGGKRARCDAWVETPPREKDLRGGSPERRLDGGRRCRQEDTLTCERDVASLLQPVRSEPGRELAQLVFGARY